MPMLAHPNNIKDEIAVGEIVEGVFCLQGRIADGDRSELLAPREIPFSGSGYASCASCATASANLSEKSGKTERTVIQGERDGTPRGSL